MTLSQLKQNFTVTNQIPSIDELLSNNYYMIIPITLENQSYWVILNNEQDYKKFTYLQSPDDYKTKEKIFGIAIEKGYAYSTKYGVPDNMQLVLSNKWEIQDKNIKRDLSVVITDKDQANDKLLHELYSKTRTSNK